MGKITDLGLLPPDHPIFKGWSVAVGPVYISSGKKPEKPSDTAPDAAGDVEQDDKVSRDAESGNGEEA